MRDAKYIWTEAWEKQAIPFTDYLIAQGYTDPSGEFTFTHDVDGYLITNDDPGLGESGTRDIYIKFFAINEAARVSNNFVAGVLGITYWGETDTSYDVSGPEWYISISVSNPPNENSPGLGLPGSIKEDRTWLSGYTGWARPQLGVWYPWTDWPQFFSIWFFNVMMIPDGSADDGETIAHEYGHGIHYTLHGDSLPSGDVPVGEEDPKDGTPQAGQGAHWVFSESSEGFAITEGWAEFFAAARYGSSSGLESNRYWMGADGQDGTNNDLNLGNIVEGAVASIFWDLWDGVNDDGVNSEFGRVWTVFAVDVPDSIWNASGDDDFYHYWVNRYGHTRAFDEVFIDHGVPVIDDSYENNDTSSTAYDLGVISGGSETFTNLICVDQDWFMFETTGVGQAEDGVQISFGGSRGNIDLYVYRQNGSLVGSSTTSSGDTETVSLNGEPAGVFRAKVVGYAGDMSPNYTLLLAAPDASLDYVVVEGPASVNENSTQDYNCRAYYTDGTNALVEPGAGWSENSVYAAISTTGLLTTYEVPSNQTCVITASYTEGGVTRQDTLNVSIVNTGRTLDYIDILGPGSVNENSTQDYNCRAYYTDGTNALVEPGAGWSENSVYATISTTGLLTTSEVPSNQLVTMSASYTEGGITRPDTHDVTIVDTEPPPAGSMQFRSPTYSENETGLIVHVNVSRTGGSYGAASVNFATANGTATAGMDYVARTGTLTWADGDSADKPIDIQITDDTVYEGNETFAINLSNANGASLGSPATTTVTIIDNETPPAGSLQFRSSTYSVNEAGTSIRALVSRNGGSYATASVNFATANGTATAGTDYVSRTGTLTWADGDSADKPIDIQITDDAVYEGNETFAINLSNANGASLGSPATTTVTIVDDDQLVSDCNGNGTDDEADIAGGTSQDCNENLVPDECEVSGQAILVSSRTGDSVFAFDAFSYRFLRAHIPAGHGGLDYPNGILVDGDGDIYVASVGPSTGVSAVKRYSGASRALELDFFSQGACVLEAPVGLAFYGNRELIVSSYTTNTVLAFDRQTGDCLGQRGSGLDGAGSLVVTPEHTLLVCSERSNQVFEFDAITGALLRIVIDAPPGLSLPAGIILDSNGRILVSSYFANSVMRFDRSGTFMDYCVPPDTGGLTNPEGLAYGVHGELLVCSRGTNSVKAYDGASCAYLRDITFGGLVQPTFLTVGTTFFDCNSNVVPDDCDIASGTMHDSNGDGISDECTPSTNHPPTDLDLVPASGAVPNVDENAGPGTLVGTLVATDEDPSETFIFSFGDGPADADGRFEINGNQLVVAAGAVIDFEQTPSLAVRIVVTDRGGLPYTEDFVIAVNDVGDEGPVITRQPGSLSVIPGGTGRFGVDVAVTGLAQYQWQRNGVDITDGGSYSGTATRELVITNVSCDLTGAYSVTVSNTEGAAVSEPAQLTLGREILLVASNANNSVVGLDPHSGRYLWNVVSPNQGNLTYPNGIAILPSGEILVTDVWSNSVVRFSLGGPLIHYSGGGLVQPVHVIAENSDRVLVAGWGSNNVVAFNLRTGDASECVAPSEGGLSQPGGLIIDPVDGSLLIGSDTAIRRFGGECGSFVDAVTGCNLDGCLGLLYDSSGNLYAVNSAASQVLRFDREGACTVFAESCNLDIAEAIEWAPNGNMLVTSYLNGAIIEFGPDGACHGVFASGPWMGQATDLKIGVITPDCNGNGLSDVCEIAENGTLDRNQNGVLDSCDCSGDLNGDGQVNLSDLAVLLAHYGQSDNSLPEEGDIDYDGDVDLSDLAFILGAFGTPCR